MQQRNSNFTNENLFNNKELEALRAQEKRKKEVILCCINTINLLDINTQIDKAIEQDYDSRQALIRSALHHELEISKAKLSTLKAQLSKSIKESTISYEINCFTAQMNLIKNKTFERIARLKIDRFNLLEKTRIGLEDKDFQEIKTIQDNLKLYLKIHQQFKADLQAELNTLTQYAAKIKTDITKIHTNVITELDKIKIYQRDDILGSHELPAQYHVTTQTMERLIALMNGQKNQAHAAEAEMNLLINRLRLLISYKDFNLENILTDLERNTVSAELVANMVTEKIAMLTLYINQKIRLSHEAQIIYENKLKSTAEYNLNEHKIALISEISSLLVFNAESLCADLKKQLESLVQLENIEDIYQQGKLPLDARLNALASEIKIRKTSIQAKIQMLDKKINSHNAPQLYQSYLTVKREVRETLSNLSYQLNALCDIENQYACRHPGMATPTKQETQKETPLSPTPKKMPCLETFFYLINLYKAQVDLYQFQKMEMENIKLCTLYDQIAAHLNLALPINLQPNKRSLEEEFREVQITNENIKTLLHSIEPQEASITYFLWAYYYAFVPQTHQGELLFNIKDVKAVDLKILMERANFEKLHTNFPLLDYLKSQFIPLDSARKFLNAQLKSLDQKHKTHLSKKDESIIHELNVALNSGSFAALETTRAFLYCFFGKIKKILYKADEFKLTKNMAQVTLIVKRIANDRHIQEIINKILNEDVNDGDIKSILNYLLSPQYTQKFEISEAIIRHALINTENEAYQARKLSLLDQTRALINQNALTTNEQFRLEKYKLLLVHLPVLDQNNIFSTLKEFMDIEANLQSLFATNQSNQYKHNLVNILHLITTHQGSKRLSRAAHKIQKRLTAFLRANKDTLVTDDHYQTITGYIVRHLKRKQHPSILIFGLGRCAETAKLHKNILAMIEY